MVGKATWPRVQTEHGRSTAGTRPWEAWQTCGRVTGPADCLFCLLWILFNRLCRVHGSNILLGQDFYVAVAHVVLLGCGSCVLTRPWIIFYYYAIAHVMLLGYGSSVLTGPWL